MDRYGILLKKTPKPKNLSPYPKSRRVYEWQGQILANEKFPRAIREHHCANGQCRALIQKGQFYKLTSIQLRYNTKCYTTFKLCLKCSAEFQASCGKSLMAIVVKPS